MSADVQRKPGSRLPLLIAAVVVIGVVVGWVVRDRLKAGGAGGAGGNGGGAGFLANDGKNDSGAPALAAGASGAPAAPAPGAGEPAEEFLSPVALVPDKEGRTLFIAEHTAKQVAAFDVAAGKVAKTVSLPDRPGGLALAPDGAKLYVAGASPEGAIHVVSVDGLKVVESLPVGHTPGALAVSPDGKTLYVCNRFNHNVSVLDLAAKKEVAKIAVLREPVAAALTPDGKSLVVANHLPVTPANAGSTSASVSILDTATNQVAATIQLPNGSTSLRGVCVSPDGQYAYVTHILGRYQLPTTQLERGWMNTNALSVIAVPDRKLVNTVLLDSVDLGAANPWGVACTADGKFLCVTHAGTHEVSVVDRAALHDKLAKAAAAKKTPDVYGSDVPNDLSFLVGLRRRIKLAGNGPRGLAILGTKVYAAEYYSDSLGVTDLQSSARPAAQSLALGPKTALAPARRGEMIFNDADRCFQKWQSCASCHPDTRADGLNWDLLNDGLGNPKNTRSLLLTHSVPPAMSLGVREKAETAVRSGFRFIQFTVPPEEECVAVDEYLKAMKQVPSPYLVKGQLSPLAKRGAAVFATAGCATCHPAPLFSDLQKHDLGFGVGLDKDKPFKTSTLREVWRTAPYLYDGRAVTLKEVLTKWNANDQHGATSKLSAEDLDALIEYVLSL